MAPTETYEIGCWCGPSRTVLFGMYKKLWMNPPPGPEPNPTHLPPATKAPPVNLQLPPMKPPPPALQSMGATKQAAGAIDPSPTDVHLSVMIQRRPTGDWGHLLSVFGPQLANWDSLPSLMACSRRSLSPAEENVRKQLTWCEVSTWQCFNKREWTIIYQYARHQTCRISRSRTPNVS